MVGAVIDAASWSEGPSAPGSRRDVVTGPGPLGQARQDAPRGLESTAAAPASPAPVSRTSLLLSVTAATAPRVPAVTVTFVFNSSAHGRFASAGVKQTFSLMSCDLFRL